MKFKEDFVLKKLVKSPKSTTNGAAEWKLGRGN
jgi:hypothetical protein